MSRIRLIFCVLVASLAVTACSSLGPRRLPADRLDYSDAVSSSWQRQMLLNIVKLRYGEMPMFLDVVSVINQYQLEGGLSALLSPEGSNEYIARGTISDRPTVTYSPLTGEAFTTSLLTPVSPVALFSLVQAGWPIDRVFEICLRRVNGIDNQSAGLVQGVADEEFAELLGLLSMLQRDGWLAMRLVSIEDPGPVAQERSVYLTLGEAPEELLEESRRARSLLNLDPEARQITITYGAQALDSTEIALLSRSVLDIMLEMAYSVHIPQEDLADGRAGRSIYDTPGGATAPRMMEIHSGDQPPDRTRISVQYRGLWFWVDDTDMRSKTTLAFLLTLFSLSEGTASGSSPILSIN